MRSLRIDEALDAQLQRAAAVRGESVSEFIRLAVAARAASTLTEVEQDFSDVVGAIHGGGGRARHTGAAFPEELRKTSGRAR